MYTRCPHCNSQQTITLSQIRKQRGLMTCVQCLERFDALASLSELPNDVAAISVKSADIWMAKPESTRSSGLWGVGSVLLLMILLLQVAYFDGDRLIRQPFVYQVVSHICLEWSCKVPEFSNPEDWSVSHSELETHLDQRYVLLGAITNQADQAQLMPKLKLTLNDFKGRWLAERLFEPEQYLDKTTLTANGTALIRIPFLLPGQAVGGYSLSLL